jgi:hypothetical protein
MALAANETQKNAAVTEWPNSGKINRSIVKKWSGAERYN